MHRNMRLYGEWMYERADIADFAKLVENGMLDLNVADIAGEYPLEEWKEAWDVAAEKTRFAQLVVLKP